MDEQTRRKIILVLLLLAVYTAVSFWVPYSKLWVMKDLMQTQSRLFYVYQSSERARNYLLGKAADLGIMVRPENIKVQTINGEVIYIELSWDAPVDILLYHTSLHFEPRIFGLIRGFENTGAGAEQPEAAVSGLSDSTASFLRKKGLIEHSINRFFGR